MKGKKMAKALLAIPFLCSAVSLVFIFLKLIGIVTWNWAVVLLPLWFPLMLVFFIGCVWVFAMLMMDLLEKE